MGHEYQDRVSLELAGRIAAGLPGHPEWLGRARETLDRWARQNSGSPHLLRCYDEWRKLLNLPVEDICAILTAKTDEGQRLRQNSPFAGILTPAEVWDIKRKLRYEKTRA